MSNARHVMFTMGSHFVILEWPELCAAEILRLIKEGGVQGGFVGGEKDQGNARGRGQHGKANKLVKKTK
jgi:hypothetical protein